MRELLVASGRLRAGLTADEAIDLVWLVTGPKGYIELVFEQGWSPDRYESWLAQALRLLVLR